MSRKAKFYPPWTKSEFRVYCPGGCGEVRGNERYGFDREHNGRDRVFPHNVSGTGKKCPGGVVDPVADRAP